MVKLPGEAVQRHRSIRLLVTTEMLLHAMAAAAHAGCKEIPGITPAAIGNRVAL